MQTELSKFEQELDAGRRSSARQRPEEFVEEVAAGQGAVARAQERLEEELVAGRRAAGRAS